MSPDHPSEDSEKIAESLVLIEFVADLYPDSPLLPKDPVLRAKARFFIDVVSTKFVPAYVGSLARGLPFEGVFAGIEAIQSLLPPEGQGKYAVGDDFTVADAAVTPFFARMEVSFGNDIGTYPEGEGKKAYELLQSDPKYARFRQYFSDLKARDSFKKTFDEVRFSASRDSSWGINIGAKRNRNISSQCITQGSRLFVLKHRLRNNRILCADIVMLSFCGVLNLILAIFELRGGGLWFSTISYILYYLVLIRPGVLPSQGVSVHWFHSVMSSILLELRYSALISTISCIVDDP